MDDGTDGDGEKLTLNHRATGSIPRRPTIFFKHLRASRRYPSNRKNCFKPVSASWAGLLSILILM